MASVSCPVAYNTYIWLQTESWSARVTCECCHHAASAHQYHSSSDVTGKAEC